MAQTVKNLAAMQETQEMWVQSLSREDALEKGMAAHSSIFAWVSQRSLAGYSPWDHKQLDMTEETNTHTASC